MSLADAPKPFFSADFGQEGGRYTWNTWEDANGWISNLQTQWAWLNSPNFPNNPAWAMLTSTVQNVSSHLNQANIYINQGQPPNIGGNLQSAQNALQALIEPNPWLLPKHPKRAFLEELRDNGKPLEAAAIAAYWLQQNLNGVPNHIAIPAIVLLEFYERGIKDRFKSENSALKRLAGELQSELDGAKQNYLAQVDRFDKMQQVLLGQSAANQVVFDESQQSRSDDWQQKLKDTQSELDNLKDTYDKHMALAAPVEYWENKRIKHNRWAIGSFVALTILMVLLGWGLHSELRSLEQTAIANSRAVHASKQAGSISPHDFTERAKVNSNAPVKDTSSSSVQTTPSATMTILEPVTSWKLASLILLATMSFWFIRIVVRIFLSNLHLENDAAERVTMVKTYLALIRDGGLPKGENIATVLAALFRPTGDGIVKDEGLPPSAMEWFTKLGGSK
ncbi:DUF6161 domain-containing protein [Massilia sp. SR12]